MEELATQSPLQQAGPPSSAEKCAVLSISLLLLHPWSKRRAAAAAAAAVSLGVRNQIAAFLPHLAAEALGHKEDEVLVQKLLGFGTLKVVSNVALHWGVRFLRFPR